MKRRALVADVGGTHVRFGIARETGDGLTIDHFTKMPSDDTSSFQDALGAYIETHGVAASDMPAVFALAGPSSDGVVTLTNRNWTISAHAIESEFGIPSVALVNDFTAMARAVPELNPADFLEIKSGSAKSDAPIIVAGPGTGFGVATLMKLPTGRWHVIGGEGGFMAYAPQTDIELELAKILRDRHGYVFNELVCAGIGFEATLTALCQIYNRTFEHWSPSMVMDMAQSGDEMFAEFCRIRARGTMRAVGDMVLTNGALGGVILAGGVSERIADHLSAPDATQAFIRRGRNTSYLENCPVHLMRDPVAPLMGAAALCLKDMT